MIRIVEYGETVTPPSGEYEGRTWYELEMINGELVPVPDSKPIVDFTKHPILKESYFALHKTVGVLWVDKDVYKLRVIHGITEIDIPVDKPNTEEEEDDIQFSYLTTMYDEYYGNITFESSVNWITPSGNVTQDGNVAVIGAKITSLPDILMDSGRTTTIVVKQDGGLSSNLVVHQRLSDETVNITFIIKNNGMLDVSFGLFIFNFGNGRSYRFTLGENTVEGGATLTHTLSLNVYYQNMEFSNETPIEGKFKNGTSINTNYLSIKINGQDATSLVGGNTYNVDFTPRI